jgi:multidrug efflux pump subunit AcrB
VNHAIAWFANNHVAANLLMVLTLVGGLLTLPTIKQEIFPEIDLPVIQVAVEYPGASPSEVEEAICVRIEEELQGLQGIRRLRSNASEGVGSVSVELLADEDVRKRLDDVRARVDAMDTFPESARRPTVKQLDVRFQVLDVAVSGDVDEWTLKRLGEKARDELAALPGITDVELVAARDYEISIEVSEEALRRYGITFDEVARAVQRSSLDLPGGSLNTSGGEILLRTTGQAYSGGDFESLALLTRPDGTRLRLGDVAQVIDGFVETDQVSRFDGRPAVLVKVFRVGQQSALEISSAVQAYLVEAENELPAGVSFTLAQDDSRLLRDRLSTLTRNARSGFALVLLVLALFLNLRLAFWVSLGVPLSFMGAIWMLPVLGVSINLISLMAFIVVLGIVVDDAIIVGEQAHTEQQQTGSALRGAIAGTQAVATPVTFGVLTTVAAFCPMLWVPGPMGRIARVVPLVVCACLLFSLIESLFVLPAHLGHGNTEDRPPRNRISHGWKRLQSAISGWLDRFIHDTYRPLLERAIEWRYLTTAIAVAMLMLTVGTLAGGWMRFVFQPEVEGEVIVAYVSMPRGTPVETTAAAVEQLNRAAGEVEAQIASEFGVRDQSVIAHVLASVGQQPYRRKQATGPASLARGSVTGSHLGEVQVEVVPAGQRNITVEEITHRWRSEAGPIVGAEELSFTSSIMSAGTPVEIELLGDDLAELGAAAATVREALVLYPGVQDVGDSFRGGPRELEIELAADAESLGITLEDLARQVRQAFYGHEAQRIQRGRDDVRVMVRYPASQRRSLEDLEKMRIRSSDGAAVPFSAVAVATLGQGYASISRVDRKRVVSVTASVDTTRTTANEILAELKRSSLPQIQELHPEVVFSFEGEQREQREVLSSLGRGWAVALLVVYALLAVPLRSYLQPLIIMSAIPFGLVGAVWGHFVMGHDFSMFSILGMVALSGVVVNDSLIFVDCANQKRRQGVRVGAALVEAGIARFRAIMLTSLTTFVGLTPLMLETSVQARMMIPMGISLAFGVVFATVISLILVPAVYGIVEDLIGAFSSPRPIRFESAGGMSSSSGETKLAIPSAAMR